MSVSIDFKYDITIFDKLYTYKVEVEDDIEDNESELLDIEKEISMLVSGNIKELMPDDEYDPIYWIKTRLDDLFEEYKRKSILIYQLGLFLDYINENKVKALIPKELMGYED